MISWSWTRGPRIAPKEIASDLGALVFDFPQRRPDFAEARGNLAIALQRSHSEAESAKDLREVSGPS
jgi:hypothetical protein